MQIPQYQQDTAKRKYCSDLVLQMARQTNIDEIERGIEQGKDEDKPKQKKQCAEEHEHLFAVPI
ncbi:MAG TPA: hypothetical protein VJB13_01955 [Candidatus Nanoarchaeia archaeon]|nr:hypothetical protein [Candidatus Nanoarchaeia archaeon]